LRTFQPFPWFEGKIRVVPHGIGGISPTTAAAKAEARGRLEWSPNDFIIIYVGRLRDVKGCDVLIDAFASCAPNHPHARVVVVGTGLEEEPLRTRVRSLDIAARVHFVGYQRELSDYYDACDLFVLPSRKEAFGYVLLEAMAREKPVIASRTGGIPEVVGADGALLVPPDDPGALAEAIDSVIRDEPLRVRLEKAGGERVRTVFPESRMYDRTEEVFREAVTVRRGSGHRQGGGDAVSQTDNPGKVATP
ncbi:MAG TPA: glycosyltransferase family 4 protein, partial [Acidobacteriota bacterium]|nr:glycosyltransferase family 4 protein [Acidobacteriota bacterium]